MKVLCTVINYLITRISVLILVSLGDMNSHILEPAVALWTLISLVRMRSIVMSQHHALGNKYFVTILCLTGDGLILVASLMHVSYVVFYVLHLFSTDVAHFLLSLLFVFHLDVILQGAQGFALFVTELTFHGFFTQVYNPDMLINKLEIATTNIAKFLLF